MKDSRMMNFIRERRREAALDLLRSCEYVAGYEIFQGMDDSKLFDLVKCAENLKIYAFDLIAAKRLVYSVEAFRDLQSDEKILSKASSDANRRIDLCSDFNQYCAVMSEIDMIDRVRREVIMKNEE